jgi:hypothetical protein
MMVVPGRAPALHRDHRQGSVVGDARRRGMVLLVVLLLLLALSSLSAGMLWVAATQNATTAARARHSRLRIEAEASALDAFARWRTPRPRHAVGETWPLLTTDSGEGGATLVTADRVTTTLTLLRVARTQAEPGGLMALARVGLLVRTVQPEEILRMFAAALTADTATLRPGAVVDADTPEAPPDGWLSTDCSVEALAAFDSLYDGAVAAIATPHPDAVALDETAILRGHPALLAAPTPASPEQVGLGPIPWNLVPEIADLTVGGSVRPEPAGIDECAVEAPANWGEPAGTGPCSSHAPVVYAPHGLVITGGTGQGLLVVDGDITLEDGARFYGAVLASGHLLLRDSARIVGAARARAAVIQDATLQYRVCTLWRSVVAAPALRRAFRPSGRWWLPDYPHAP